MPPMDAAWLPLPERFTPARVTTSQALPPDTPVTLAELEGPGCIRRIFAATVRRPTPAHQRQIILRMFWDGADTPAVEAPLGDFFGQLHGLPPYALDSRYLTTQFHAGYTATFPMPFQHGARIEVEAGPSVEDAGIVMQIDWHAYPPESSPSPLRFHAQFRREYPCEAYGRNYLLLDAVGRGRFLGFNYGVAVRDDRARWSHAGAENIYVTNGPDALEGPFAHLRGAGGEDTFGASYGGVLHQPSTHLDQGVPYYAQEDIGPALARHTLAAYRFFEADAIPFGRSIQVRFGSMANDICSTAYWYQEPPHRPFARMPAWDQLLPGAALPFDATGAPEAEPRWQLLGPFHPDHEAALDAAADRADPAQRFPETGYPLDSAWRRDGRHVARWVPAADIHGFVDFTLAFRPIAAENSLTYPALGLAQTWLHVDADAAVTVQAGWVNDLRLRVGDSPWASLGRHAYFRNREHRLALRAGWNRLQVKLDNPDDGMAGQAWGSWVFALRVIDDRGREIALCPEPAC